MADQRLHIVDSKSTKAELLAEVQKLSQLVLDEREKHNAEEHRLEMALTKKLLDERDALEAGRYSGQIQQSKEECRRLISENSLLRQTLKAVL